MRVALAHRLNNGIELREASSSDDSRDVDKHLVKRFQEGERSAFDQLVRRHQKPLYYLALRYVKNEADAKDILQKSCLRAYKALGRFRGESSVRTWLFRIVINLSLNHIRDNSRKRKCEIEEDTIWEKPVGASRVINQERAKEIRQAIEKLPQKQRNVLELRIYNEMSFKEVAQTLGCTENAAKVNFHHAVKRLRKDIPREKIQ